MVKEGGAISERVARLREAVLGPPEICIERGCLMTESYRETESEPFVIRRARALENILKKMTVHIEDGELIVGRTTSKRRGGLLTPEVQWEWYLREMETLSTREWDRCLPFTEDEKLKMRESLPYWRGKSLYDKWLAVVPEDVLKINNSRLYVTNTGCLSGAHLAHVAVDFEKVLKIGLKGIRQEVAEEQGRLELTDVNDFRKLQQCRAAAISLEAAVAFASRYAGLAAEMAAAEKDAQRKAELEEIAGICGRVPAAPAQTFREALQSIWLTFIVLRIEGWGPGIGFGRPDQYLYPFYKGDIEEGRITREEALELLALLLVKINDAAIIMSSEFGEQLAGFPTMANITLGGVTADGRDAVNELSYLFLEAEKVVGLTVEEYVVRVNKINPEAFLMKACEVARALNGKLKFVSDDTIIQQLLSDGKPVEYARQYALVGCFTPAVPVYSFDTSATMVNLPLMLELALNDGVSRLTGKRLGPRTGDPRRFETYDDLWAAFRKQVEAIVPAGILLRAIDRQMFADYAPCPFLSSLYRGCIRSGADIANGGTAPYATEGHGLVGAPNVGDSLAAIRKFVFDDKRLGMDRLLAALDGNFEGEEDVKRLLESAPRFGNDDEYVDIIVNDVLTLVSDEIRKYLSIAGTKPTVAASAGTGHLALGEVVGALPDGRKAGEPLSEGGISPYQGRNVSGPAAAMRSVAGLNHLKLTGGSVFNMRFNPEVLKDEAKLRKFASLIRTYGETGGYLVQFNITSTETLREAQKNPQQYRDLLVRVATYSAYFVELSPRLQEDIIARMEFQEV